MCVYAADSPSPKSFATFDEYEAALLRWASLCSASLPAMPPHATQLPSLLPVRNVVDGDKQRGAVVRKQASEDGKEAKGVIIHKDSTRRRRSTALPMVQVRSSASHASVAVAVSVCVFMSVCVSCVVLRSHIV